MREFIFFIMNNLRPFKDSQGSGQEAGGGEDIGQGSVDTVFSIVQLLHNAKNDLLYILNFFTCEKALCSS